MNNMNPYLMELVYNVNNPQNTMKTYFKNKPISFITLTLKLNKKIK